MDRSFERIRDLLRGVTFGPVEDLLEPITVPDPEILVTTPLKGSPGNSRTIHCLTKAVKFLDPLGSFPNYGYKVLPGLVKDVNGVFLAAGYYQFQDGSDRIIRVG